MSLLRIANFIQNKAFQGKIKKNISAIAGFGQVA